MKKLKRLLKFLGIYTLHEYKMETYPIPTTKLVGIHYYVFYIKGYSKSY